MICDSCKNASRNGGKCLMIQSSEGHYTWRTPLFEGGFPEGTPGHHDVWENTHPPTDCTVYEPNASPLTQGEVSQLRVLLERVKAVVGFNGEIEVSDSGEIRVLAYEVYTGGVTVGTVSPDGTTEKRSRLIN